MDSASWYTIEDVDQLDSPSVVIYIDRVKENIKTLIKSIDDINRLRPHIKTHKSAEVTQMMMDAGIHKFKCATIAEAEMMASAGAPDVLLAYQPVGPKIERLASLTQRFPETVWSCLIDNIETAKAIAAVFERLGQSINVYIDLNVGMNRTGILPQHALTLFEVSSTLTGISVVGLHAYDGHLRDADFAVRTAQCDQAFANVKNLQVDILKRFGKKLTIIAGGTPTFSIHRKRKEIECSPGTFIYWDKGYEQILQEQHYQHAALVITRVVSLPAENTVCTDLGHKSIASENPLSQRICFLNAPDLQPIGHSEEHMVFKTTGEKKYNVGDVLYGVPFHVCPTIALYDAAYATKNHHVKEKWNTESRNRKITV